MGEVAVKIWFEERHLPSLASLVLPACREGEGLGFFVVACDHDDPVARVHDGPSHRPNEAHEVFGDFVSTDFEMILVLTQ